MTWYSGFPSTTEGWAEFNRNEAAKNAARNRREAREAQDEINERLKDITDALIGKEGAAEIIKLKRRVKELEEENRKLRQDNNKSRNDIDTYGFISEFENDFMERRMRQIMKNTNNTDE